MRPRHMTHAHTPHAQVIDPDRRRFIMLYEAVAADGTRSVGVATSKDGRGGWARSPAPLLSPAGGRGAWDAGGVGAPCAVPMAGGRGRWTGARGGPGGGGGGGAAPPGPWEGVGLALSAQGAADPFAQPFRRRTGAAGPAAEI
jgi:hypothetical protein